MPTSRLRFGEWALASPCSLCWWDCQSHCVYALWSPFMRQSLSGASGRTNCSAPGAVLEVNRTHTPDTNPSGFQSCLMRESERATPASLKSARPRGADQSVRLLLSASKPDRRIHANDMATIVNRRKCTARRGPTLRKVPMLARTPPPRRFPSNAATPTVGPTAIPQVCRVDVGEYSMVPSAM